jgi:diaminopimelate decarboxylase
MKVRAPFALRVNPDVNAETHPYISTGLRDHKFGVPFEEAWELYRWAQTQPSLEIRGVSVHIGSQMLDFAALTSALDKTLDFAAQLAKHDIKISVLDVGGGVGVAYNQPDVAPPLDLYGDLLRKTAARWQTLQGAGSKLCCECGRAVVGQAGWLVTRVVGIKLGSSKNFAIADASMTELLRPALYGAQHPVECWTPGAASRRKIVYDLVGPVCESSDVLAYGQLLPELEEGDLLAIGVAGAYGIVMASQYNARPWPQEWWLAKDGSIRESRDLNRHPLLTGLA